ncbi:MAG: ferredoxin, partial [Clostridia bacterium]|nr:ferredoxin [Clostridia bacterium]
KWRVTLMGCPKLDGVDYSEKLSKIIKNNYIKSVTLVRMEMPCCGGLRLALEKALSESGKVIPWRVVVISTDGRIMSE